MSTIDEVSKGIHSIDLGGNGDSWLLSGGFVLVRVFLITGALFYMWQIRHPKVE
jgi:hypothetical protein